MLRQIEPMLAYKPPLGPKGKELLDSILADVTGTWVCDEKKDGSRYLDHLIKGKSVYTGRHHATDTGRLTEVTGGKLQHIDFDIPKLYGTVLDGEYMGTSAASMIAHEYFVFDIISYKGKDLFEYPLRSRDAYKRKAVREILNEYPLAPISVLPRFEISQGKALFTKLVEKGGEGLVLKNLKSLYIPGSSSRNAWVKYKKRENFDVVITGYVSSTSDKYGPKGFNSFKHLFASQYNDAGELIEVCSIPATGWKDVEHETFRGTVQRLVGLIAEVEGMERASKGVRIREPRFLRWRDDKNQKDCIFDK